MAALIAGAIGELGSLLSGTGIGATLARGALTGLGAVAASDILKAIQNDIKAGPTTAAATRRVPRFVVVDTQKDIVIMSIGSKRLYRLLTHHSRRTRTSRARVVAVNPGQQLVEVR